MSGIQLVEAELISGGTAAFYELEGRKDNTEYEILISLEGDLIKIERDD